MIQFAKSYRTSDARHWETLKEAQLQEMTILLVEIPMPPDVLELSAQLLVQQKAKVIEILTCQAWVEPDLIPDAYTAILEDKR